MSGGICDRRIYAGEGSETCYGLERAALTKRREVELEVADLCLGWSVLEMSLSEGQLGHVQRRDSWKQWTKDDGYKCRAGGK